MSERVRRAQERRRARRTCAGCRTRHNATVALRVEVKPELLVWARQRAGIALGDLTDKFPKLRDWEEGDQAPTLRQLEKFATATRTPVGYLLLDEPPEERLPIPDYRTMRGEAIRRPSPDLLDTIFQSQQRQEWYSEFARASGEEPLPFVGSLTTNTPVTEAAATMRAALAFEVAERGPTWTQALRLLIGQAEEVGVLVMVSGIVGNNTRRKLDPDEFRGFALIDPFAPVVFVNGVDTKAAQIFTLAHELAHIWLGQPALSDAELIVMPAEAAERWCNSVAAEFLVPLDAIAGDFDPGRPLTEELDRLARRFKVSTLVVLRRIHDARHLDWHAYRAAYLAELDRLHELLEARGPTEGGNFYSTQPLRVSRRFARAIVNSTLEGQTLYREAFRMLGFKKASTFNELAARLRQD